VTQDDRYFDDGDDDTWVRVRRPVRGGRRFAGLSGIVTTIVVVALVGSWLWVDRRVDPPGGPGAVVEVVVPLGSTTADIAALLETEGVVADGGFFRYYVRFKGSGGYEAGSYEFTRNSSMAEALRVLEAGPFRTDEWVNVTFPEGYRLAQFERRLLEEVPDLDPEALRAALRNGVVRSALQPPGASLEGFLFPDTYRIDDELSEAEIVRMFVEQFDAVATEVDLVRRSAELGLTPFEVLVVASMIEEETFVPDERPKVAQVVYNRIARGMTLGIDATVLYAVGKETGPITRSDLDVDSPYNTRKFPGLPPGPIASPGRASIEAALAPADGPWLYYVLADADGRHFFTESAAEFERQVAISDALGLLE